MTKDEELKLLEARLPYTKYGSADDLEPDMLIAFQRTVGTWSDKTFSSATDSSRIAHMQDELKELLEHPADPYEMADIFLLLLHHAHANGVDLEMAARVKFDILQKRKWGQPDERGVVTHIKE